MRRWTAEEWAEARVRLHARARGRCECCGEPLRNRVNFHHRKLRSQLGQDDDANLLAVLPEHHARIHARPAWARAHGFIVSSSADPGDVPVVRCRPGGSCPRCDPGKARV